MAQLETAVLWAPTGTGDVQRLLSTSEFQPRVQAFTKLITLCGRAGDPVKALEVFEAMKAEDSRVRPNTYSYSALIFALGNGGMWEQALSVFAEMKAAARTDPQCKPSLISYSSAIAACEKGQEAETAVHYFREMIQDGIRPDRVVFLSVIEVSVQAERWDLAEQMLDAMHSYGIAGSNRVYKVFLDRIAVAGGVEEALDLFLTIQMLGNEPDSAICEALLRCFEAHRRLDMALDLWGSMQQAGIGLTANANDALRNMVFACKCTTMESLAVTA